MSDVREQPAFDIRPAHYDALVNWDRRLAREELFYRFWFELVEARRVLDTACGTGHHAGLFASWGLEVEAADVSADMIACARRQHRGCTNINWQVRSFDQPVICDQPFDAVICTGNSLSLAADMASAAKAVHQMMAALRTDGIMVIHVLNLWSLPQGPTTWQKALRTVIDGQEQILLKGIHRAGDRGYVDFARLVLDGGGLASHFEQSAVLGIEADHLAEWIGHARGQALQFFGGYGQGGYDRETSGDLIVVATKAD